MLTLLEVSHPPAWKLSLKPYSQLAACGGPDQQRDLATDIRITALLCSARGSVVLEENAPSPAAAGTQPSQSARRCEMDAGLVRLPWAMTSSQSPAEQVKVTAALFKAY